jgi:hypothetical protein
MKCYQFSYGCTELDRLLKPQSACWLCTGVENDPTFIYLPAILQSDSIPKSNP